MTRRRLSNAPFKPNSIDAQLAGIKENLKAQDRSWEEHRRNQKDDLKGYRDEIHAELEKDRKNVNSRLDYIKAAVDLTNGRVTGLERKAWVQKGIVIAMGTIAGLLSWLLPWLFASPKK